MTHAKIAYLTINEMPSHFIDWRITQFDGNIYIGIYLWVDEQETEKKNKKKQGS